VLLIIGLIKPKTLSKFFKKEPNRIKILLLFGGFTFLFFIMCGVVADSSELSGQNISNIKNQQKPIIENNEEIVENNQNDEQLENQLKDSIITIQPELKPTPTPKPIVEEEPEPELESELTLTETVSQKNALAKAKDYLNYSAFSHDGLVEQLEYEQFSHSDSIYGADNCGANWNEQAAKKAESYMEYSAFSRGSLIEQLLYEKFTQAQAEYGVDSVGL